MIGNLTLGARYHLVEAMWPTGGQKMLSTQVKHLELESPRRHLFLEPDGFRDRPL